MAHHHLIEDYLATLRRRLPADAVDELADGLTETYQRHLSRGLDPDHAADAALTEFGEPDIILAAFVSQSPGRRTARALLYSGPAVGACWAASLIVAHAQTSAISTPAKIGVGATLIVVISTLVVAATSSRSYRRTKAGALGGLGLILLDLTVLTAVLLAAIPPVWPMILAIPASATRVALTARALPRLLAQQ